MHHLKPLYDFVLCNAVNLPIYHNKLNGTLPDSLYELVDLRFLEASNNELTGELRPEIGNLAHLKIINFRQNGLRGTIPEEIKKLKDLHEFYPYN